MVKGLCYLMMDLPMKGNTFMGRCKGRANLKEQMGSSIKENGTKDSGRETVSRQIQMERKSKVSEIKTESTDKAFTLPKMERRLELFGTMTSWFHLKNKAPEFIGNLSLILFFQFAH